LQQNTGGVGDPADISVEPGGPQAYKEGDPSVPQPPTMQDKKPANIGVNTQEEALAQRVDKLKGENDALLKQIGNLKNDLQKAKQNIRKAYRAGMQRIIRYIKKRQ
jgi:hypothetical protein